MNYLLFCFSNVDNFSPLDPFMQHFNKSGKPERMQQMQHTYSFLFTDSLVIHVDDFLQCTGRNVKVVLNKREESYLALTCRLYFFKLHTEKKKISIFLKKLYVKLYLKQL